MLCVEKRPVCCCISSQHRNIEQHGLGGTLKVLITSLIVLTLINRRLNETLQSLSAPAPPGARHHGSIPFQLCFAFFPSMFI